MVTRCSDVRLNDRRPHTFTDMSREPKPDSSEVVEDDREVSAPKRRRTDGQEEADVDIEGEDDNGHLDETAPQKILDLLMKQRRKQVPNLLDQMMRATSVDWKVS